MGRSHPPSLRTAVRRLLADEGLVRRGDRVLCAVSGGPDSTALLHVLAAERERTGFTLVAHGVDHGLRPQAALELDGVEALARQLEVPFGRTAISLALGGNLQDRARRARYAVLERVARDLDANVLATGHTADDRAETFLLRLLRGSGPRGLAVLPPVASRPGGLRLVRPLVTARRRDVVAHLGRHGLVAAEDPSNGDARFARTRVRHEVLPLLESLSPNIVGHLNSLAEMLEADASLGDGVAVGLGRAQRLALRRARRLGREAVTLRVKGGRDVLVTFPGGGLVLTPRPTHDDARADGPDRQDHDEV